MTRSEIVKRGVKTVKIYLDMETATIEEIQGVTRAVQQMLFSLLPIEDKDDYYGDMFAVLKSERRAILGSVDPLIPPKRPVGRPRKNPLVHFGRN